MLPKKVLIGYSSSFFWETNISKVISSPFNDDLIKELNHRFPNGNGLCEYIKNKNNCYFSKEECCYLPYFICSFQNVKLYEELLEISHHDNKKINQSFLYYLIITKQNELFELLYQKYCGIITVTKELIECSMQDNPIAFKIIINNIPDSKVLYQISGIPIMNNQSECFYAIFDKLREECTESSFMENCILWAETSINFSANDILLFLYKNYLKTNLNQLKEPLRSKILCKIPAATLIIDHIK